MTLIRLRLIRTPHHFVPALIVAFINLMIVFVMCGVWALQLIIFGAVALAQACMELGALGRPEPEPEPPTRSAA